MIRYLPIGLLLLLGCGPEKAQQKFKSLPVAEALSGDTTGYSRAYQPRQFAFPADHGAHPDFKAEWWYFTGNLKAKDGRRFGYQFTIFRSALKRDTLSDPAAWNANQLYMGHFTVSDIEGGKFHFAERFSRGDGRLAGAIDPLRVWINNWQLQPTGKATFPLRIEAAEKEYSIALLIDSTKGILLQGNKGLSQKGTEQGNASYYYSLTRLPTTGRVLLGADTFEVEGSSWFDREWSTSALGGGQVGWDWFSLQLSDNEELMYYQLRQKDGTADVTSAGKLQLSDGTAVTVAMKDVTIEVLETWKSPGTGVVYPSGWRLRIPKEEIDVTIRPLLKDQELRLTLSYWEGAVEVKGTRHGKPISGEGYVELTGYSDQLTKLR